MLGASKPAIGLLTPKLPISRDPNGIPTGVPIILDDDPTVVGVGAVRMEDDDDVEQVFNSDGRIETAGDVTFVDVVVFRPPPLKLESGEVIPAIPELDTMGVGARALIQPVLPTLPAELTLPRG
jgi:hypothetical protein